MRPSQQPQQRRDPRTTARALFESGDVDGAERVLAEAVLQDGADADKCARALALLAQRRGDLGMRGQQALERYLERRPPRGADDVETHERIALLFEELGIGIGGAAPAAVAAAAQAPLPSLPDLDGFAAPVTVGVAESTDEQPRPRSLADVRIELEQQQQQRPVPLDELRAEIPAADTVRNATSREISDAVFGELPREDDDDIGADASDIHAVTAAAKAAVAATAPDAPPVVDKSAATRARVSSKTPGAAAKTPGAAAKTPGARTPGAAAKTPGARAPATPGRSAGTPGPGPAALEIGRLFEVGALVKERYDVMAVVGRGGHATVLRVHDRELDEECALKVFHQSGDAADVARFKREVSLSRRINHPNVVRLYDIGQEGGFYFLTMELLDGEDLATALKTRPVMLDQALEWLVQACHGLAAAHALGIVHRDVKPANLFLTSANTVKVMDFGIAKPADSAALTSTGMFVGTPQYVSPEQVKGLDVTIKADIYALGCVGYLMVTGTLPFRDKELVALLMKHVTLKPDPPQLRNPDVPDRLNTLLMWCLEKKPADRPESCAVVAAELERILHGS